jgi:cellulose synthase/poly-beta-1,6-N-acetylglucosamine synthase-like glycosyltransferase
MISLRIAREGYKIAYTPNAYAEETASLNVSEELKRKIRIAAGGIQTIFRLKSLLNPFKYGLLTWQYFSHKVLRWTLAPLSLFAIFVVNVIMVWTSGNWVTPDFYTFFLYIQTIGYFLAFAGWILENNQLRFKLLFVPYYFTAINYAAIRGMYRYFKGKQTVKWEKSKRA